MTEKDYYKIMGLTRDATEKDIKVAYRRLARKYHPDLSKDPHAKEQFQALGEAYEVLKDKTKRKAYDEGQLYQSQFNQQTHQESPYARGHASEGGFGFHPGMGEEIDGDLFESLFGGGGRFHRGPRPGANRQGTLHVSLEEAYNGTVKIIQLPSVDPTHSEARKVKVNIPAGIRSGQPIRLAGQGEPGTQGGPLGDLYLTIEIDKHPLFDVMGDDIYLTLPVTPWEAALGASIKIPTLGGVVGLKIPPGSQGGQTLRLKHRGLQGKTPGDQYILLKIMIPTPNTDSQKAFYQTMEQEMPFNPREKWGVLHG